MNAEVLIWKSAQTLSGKSAQVLSGKSAQALSGRIVRSALQKDSPRLRKKNHVQLTVRIPKLRCITITAMDPHRVTTEAITCCR